MSNYGSIGHSLADYRFPWNGVRTREVQLDALPGHCVLDADKARIHKLVRPLYEDELDTEQLCDFYSTATLPLPAELPAPLFLGEFILHPSASPELVRHISSVCESMRYSELILPAISSTPATSQEHLIHLVGIDINRGFKHAIVNHPNSDFEVWKAVFFSGALGSRAESELLARPAFEAGIRALFKDIEGEDLSDLPLEWLLGLCDMHEMDQKEVMIA